jgi:hypothetical protein
MDGPFLSSSYGIVRKWHEALRLFYRKYSLIWRLAFFDSHFFYNNHLIYIKQLSYRKDPHRGPNYKQVH